MIRKVSKSTLDTLRDRTDWKRVKAMTEADIKKAALMDPDAKELLPHELAQFKRGRIPIK